ncbi:autotransporter outer membrane beta-barrel domain-containing protein, partial [Campylobacter sp. W0014]|nr:autotransporter outer membrane beta-barrel domain-containing protein [Campylobacter sp. W0014]
MVIWAKDDSTKSTITNFNNSGIISSNDKESIFIKNTTIDNFTNNGTISSTQGQGINISSGTTISTFENSGTISSTQGQGINISSGTTISTFENSGTISSDQYQGINISGKAIIDKFENSGVIQSSGSKEPTDTGTLDVSAGIKLKDTCVKTFENTGSIYGKFGIKMAGTSIDKFENAGLIESTSKHKFGAAISVSNLSGQASVIKTLTNSGTIKADNASGILIEAGNKIETLTNKGTIEAGLYGISFFTIDQYGGEIELGQINLEN